MNTPTEQVNLLQGQSYYDVSLAKYTSWRIGGRAKRLYKPANLSDLVLFLQTLPQAEPILFLGLGSNTLVRDKGFPGTVIVTQSCLNELSVQDNGMVYAQAGVSCAQMARFCARNSLANGEFWAGIPGTMGGALRMNAGCYNGETWDNVRFVDVIDRTGKIARVSVNEFKVSYRSVTECDGTNIEQKWFVAGLFQFPSGQKQASLDCIKKLLERRNQSQPTGEYNCGSVFRNPEGDFAARLIESCGLKGKAIGHACISEKHANFIVNREGLATAAEIETLIDFIHKEVLTQTGIDLHREVHIVGNNNG